MSREMKLLTVRSKRAIQILKSNNDILESVHKVSQQKSESDMKRSKIENALVRNNREGIAQKEALARDFTLFLQKRPREQK